VSVTAPKGFRAGSVDAGLSASTGPDLTVIVNDGPKQSAAAVFTSNRAKAHPIRWSMATLADGQARAIVLNSGGANCFTGPEGFQLAHKSAEHAAEVLMGAGVECSGSDVVICSTGLIGEPLPSGAVIRGIEVAISQLDDSSQAGEQSARAIMTTDSHPKTLTREVAGVTIGAMAKGAGMLAPGLATMLVVITTDADYEPDTLDRMLRVATSESFDRLDSDGCMSTNDQVTLMASGASGNSPDEAVFQEALTGVCIELAQMLQRDAEGASHDITIDVVRAVSVDDALAVGRAVARSNLFKAAVFGNDPNWGRILSAIGTAPGDFVVDQCDVSINGVRVCAAGQPDRPRSEVDMTSRAVHVEIDLRAGEASGVIWTNDLTHDYVHENSAYSS